MNILNWTSEVEEDWKNDKTYVVIKVNGEEVARNSGDDYVGCDCCGGGGHQDVALDMIRKAFVRE